MAPQLPWSDEMISTFLNLVISKGVHVADKAVVKKTWNELHDDLYKNACWAPYKAVHYKKGDCRHLKDKLKRLIESISEGVISANKSKESGDLSTDFTLAEQIIRETNENKENKNSKKEEAVEFEKLLDDTEAKVLKKKQYGKRKDIDGNIVDYSEGKRKCGNAADDAIVAIVDVIKSSVSSKIEESKIEKYLISWMKSNNKGVDELLEASEIPDSDPFYKEAFDIVTSIGLKTIVSLFCSRGKAFARDSFQNSMKEMECRPIIYHKLYVGLDEWRQLASEFDKSNSFVSPPASMEQLTRSSTSNSSNEGTDDEELVLI